MWGRQGTTSVVPEGVSNQLLFLTASAAEGRTSGAKAQPKRRGFSAWLKPCPDDFHPLNINGENALKQDFQGQLDLPRGRRRAGDSSGRVQRGFPVALRRVDIRAGHGEVGAVGQIEELRAELELPALAQEAQRRIFRHGEIQVGKSWTAQNAA